MSDTTTWAGTVRPSDAGGISTAGDGAAPVGVGGDGYYDETPWGVGMATTLHIDADPDPAELVRAVAEEVAGKAMPARARPRMGFL